MYLKNSICEKNVQYNKNIRKQINVNQYNIANIILEIYTLKKNVQIVQNNNNSPLYHSIFMWQQSSESETNIIFTSHLVWWAPLTTGGQTNFLVYRYIIAHIQGHSSY